MVLDEDCRFNIDRDFYLAIYKDDNTFIDIRTQEQIISKSSEIKIYGR